LEAINLKLYVLTDGKGRLLSLDPATDQFFCVHKYESLKIWDVQPYNDEMTWFMGNSPRPKFAFRIKEVPKKHLSKFS